MVAGLLLGLPPALRALPRRTSIDLAEAGLRTTGGRTHHRTLRFLVGAQLALATVLLVGLGPREPQLPSPVAGRSRIRSGGPAHLPACRFPTATTRSAQRSRGLPPHAWSSGSARCPASPARAARRGYRCRGSAAGTGHSLEDFPREPEEVPPVFMTQRVTPGYFETLGIPLVAGRDFTSEEQIAGAARRDRQRDHRAEVLGPSGRRRQAHRAGRTAGRSRTQWFTIVGVAGPVRDENLHDPPRDRVYYPLLLAASDARTGRLPARSVRGFAAAAPDGLRRARCRRRPGRAGGRGARRWSASSIPTSPSPISSR